MVIILPYKISTFCSLESVSLVLGKFLQHRRNRSLTLTVWNIVHGIAMSSFSTTCVAQKVTRF